VITRVETRSPSNQVCLRSYPIAESFNYTCTLIGDWTRERTEIDYYISFGLRNVTSESADNAVVINHRSRRFKFSSECKSSPSVYLRFSLLTYASSDFLDPGRLIARAIILSAAIYIAFTCVQRVFEIM